MKYKLFLFIILIIQVVNVASWIVTNSNFPDNFHYSSLDLKLRLIESIHNDVNSPIWITRLFHNKFIGSFFDIFDIYLRFWDFKFLISFFSLSGIVGLFLGFYYYISKDDKKVSERILFVLILNMPFIEILFPNKIHFILRVLLLVIIYFSWSIFGYTHLIKNKPNIYFLLGLIILSLWLLPFKTAF